MATEPWRYAARSRSKNGVASPACGVSIALRVTPRGGKDRIDGLETLADGRSVLKVRVRAVAEGGEANRAVTELLAKELGVRKTDVKLLSGVTSRLKQIAVDGDPRRLGERLRQLVGAASPDRADE